MSVLEVKNIEKHFGDTRVLKDISFTLEKGQAMSIPPQQWCRVNGLHVCFGGQEEFAEAGR